MATEAELKNAISEAISALNGIVGEAEKFVYEHVTNRSGKGWNDNCGQKIGKAIVSSVEDAVDRELHFMADLPSQLEDISDSITSIISTINDANKELRK